MKIQTYQLEMELISTRTRQFVGGSVAVHLLLISFLLIQQKFAPMPMGITEITWIDPVEIPAPAAEPTSPPIAEKVVERPEIQAPAKRLTREEPKQQFRRELKRADFAPKPQTESAIDDKLSHKLSSLRRATDEKQAQITALLPPTKIGKPALAGTPVQNPGTRETSTLKREDTPRSAPLKLKRVDASKSRPAVAVSAMPETRPSNPTMARVDESTARRELAGAQIAGPVADRPILTYETPVYPEWAKRDGVDGSVTLYFIVRSDGYLKENILVQKTAGFQDFDNNAIAALRKWRFKPLPAGQTAEQWGAITFHYRLGGNAVGR